MTGAQSNCLAGVVCSFLKLFLINLSLAHLARAQHLQLNKIKSWALERVCEYKTCRTTEWERQQTTEWCMIVIYGGDARWLCQKSTDHRDKPAEGSQWVWLEEPKECFQRLNHHTQHQCHREMYAWIWNQEYWPGRKCNCALKATVVL